MKYGSAITALCLILIASTSSVIQAEGFDPTEEDFVRWENAWDRLIPSGTYDFVPKDFGYELLFNPNFQVQLDAAGKVASGVPQAVVPAAGDQVASKEDDLAKRLAALHK